MPEIKEPLNKKRITVVPSKMSLSNCAKKTNNC